MQIVLAALLACLMLTTTAAQEEQQGVALNEPTARLFELGLTALEIAERTDSDAARRDLYDKAIAAFRAILINQPNLVRVRLELARTFFLNGQDGLARRHFEAVLAGGVPLPVAANIYHFLNIMQARKRLTGYFGLAFAPDSNLNAASESEIVYIDTVFGRLPFQREGDFGAQSGFGVSVWGGGEYQQPLSERLRLRVGADLAVREYPRSDFDQTFLAAHVGPRWLASPITEISLLATAQRQWLGSIPYVDETGVRLELDRRLTPRLWARGNRGVPRARSPEPRLSRRPGGRFHRHFCVDAGAGTARAHDGGLRARPCGIGTLAQPVALDAGGHVARPAAGFHPGHQRPDAAHVLRRQRPSAP